MKVNDLQRVVRAESEPFARFTTSTQLVISHPEEHFGVGRLRLVAHFVLDDLMMLDTARIFRSWDARAFLMRMKS